MRPKASRALRNKRYTIVAVGMLSLGGLLLAVSAGYYIYAQLSKMGREDLVHAVERPTASVVTIPTFAPALDGEAKPARPAPALQLPQPHRTTAVSSAPHERNSPNSALDSPEPTEVVTSARDLAAFGLRGAAAHPTVQSAMEAAQTSPTSSEEQPETRQTNSGQLDSSIQLTNPRAAAAIEVITLRQARRGMNLPGYVNTYQEDETTNDPTIEPDEDSTRSGAFVYLPPRRPVSPLQTSEDMVAQLEIDTARRTHQASEPQPATLMTVPGIGLKALVEELEVVDTGDSRAWETPKHAVGHIPTTAKPGSAGQGWYFGHLQSPIRGEGSVFRRLPELAARFKKGERFTINLDAGGLRYVYEVYQTDVIHQSELALSDSGQNDITLVACWPEYVYSERVLVTAALVDVVDVPEPDQTSVAMSGL